jgi:hypothetical protein
VTIPTLVEGLSNPPASGLTPFYGYPVMGADNNPSNSPVDNVITFPVAGTYPFEYDLAAKVPHNWEGTMTTIVNGVEKVIPPAGYLALTPNTLASQTTGASLNFGLIVVDASGAVVANTPVVFSVTGANARQSTTTTDATGHATFTYTGTQPGGVDTVQATATINGTTGYSNSVQISWNNGTNQAPVVNAGSPQSVVLPNTITLTGSVSDDGLPLNSTLTITWSMASGPGTVTFGNPHSPVTAAAFDKAGTYVLQLSASDSALTTTANVTITVTGSANPGSPPGTDEPGWISGVTDHGTVTGVVTISVPASVTLQSGTLSYWPISNPTAITVLNGNTMGSGAIGTLDTTLLANGTYWIRLTATNTSGTTTNNQALVTVARPAAPSGHHSWGCLGQATSRTRFRWPAPRWHSLSLFACMSRKNW